MQSDLHSQSDHRSPAAAAVLTFCPGPRSRISFLAAAPHGQYFSRASSFQSHRGVAPQRGISQIPEYQTSMSLCRQQTVPDGAALCLFLLSAITCHRLQLCLLQAATALLNAKIRVLVQARCTCSLCTSELITVGVFMALLCKPLCKRCNKFHTLALECQLRQSHASAAPGMPVSCCCLFGPCQHWG